MSSKIEKEQEPYQFLADSCKMFIVTDTIATGHDTRTAVADQRGC